MSSRDELNDLKRRVERVENTVLAPGTDYVLRTESEQAVTCWRDLYHKVAERRNALQKDLDEAKAALDDIRRARIGDSERLNAMMTERDTARENVRKLSDQLVNPPLTPAGEKELKRLQTEVKVLRYFSDVVAAAVDAGRYERAD